MEVARRPCHRVWPRGMSIASALLWLNCCGGVIAQAPSQKAAGEVRALSEKAARLRNENKAKEALPLAQEALRKAEADLGPDHADVGLLASKLADTYVALQNYPAALPVAKRALAIVEREEGEDSKDTFDCVDKLADIRMNLGDHVEAERLYFRAMAMAEKHEGENGEATGTIADALARMYLTKGDYAKAEPLARRALEIAEKRGGKEAPAVAGPANNLAEVYRGMGDNARAHPLLEKAVAIALKTAPNAVTTAMLLNNLGTSYGNRGDLGKAEEQVGQGLKILVASIGMEHPLTVSLLNNMGSLYNKAGGYAQAEPFFQAALEIRIKVLGPKHPLTAMSMRNVGNLYENMGDDAKAEPFLEHALELREEALGPTHPNTAISLKDIAHLRLRKGQLAEALSVAERYVAAEEARLANVLSFGSEAQRLKFQNSVSPYNLLATLGAGPQLAQSLFRWKGVVLDSLIEDRAAAQAADAAGLRTELDRVRAAKQRLFQLTADPSPDEAKRTGPEQEQLRGEIEAFESKLARKGAGQTRRALAVEAGQVQAALHRGVALVEFVAYVSVAAQPAQARYGAVVMAGQIAPHWVDLGPAAAIDKAVRGYQRAARGETDNTSCERTLRQICQLVWTPIERALPQGTGVVILSPDGEISFISFATLLDEAGAFLAERFTFSYATSGRDLLRAGTPPIEHRLVCFGDPDYAATSKVKGPADAVRKTTGALNFRPLPGTRDECEQLGQAFKEAGWSSDPPSFAAAASEPALAAIRHPGILHLATHGFLLPAESPGATPSPSGSAAQRTTMLRLLNPMHRSGLALAGAQRTIEQWERGQAPAPEQDGIVTAEEVGTLSLDGTWLVTLSACETGRGEARAGEGVLGLQRGFIQAGAQNLLLTLWPIRDDTTVKLMLDFYRRALASQNAPRALAEVQRDWLKKLREQHGLLTAVNQAGAFIMSSTGQP